jgi:hypothetical protein
MDAILADPSNPSRLLPAYISATVPPHYNDLGTAAMVPAVQQLLFRIAALRPR